MATAKHQARHSQSAEHAPRHARPMLRVSLRNIAAHKLRLLLSVLAVVLGTAFVTVVMLRRRGAFEGTLARRIDARTGRLLRGDLADRFGGRELGEGGMRLVLASLRGIALAGIALLAVEILLLVLTLGRFTTLGAAGTHGLEVYTGAGVLGQVVLSVVGAGLLGMFLFRLVDDDATRLPSAWGSRRGSDGAGAGGASNGASGSRAAGVAHSGWGRLEWVAALVTAAFLCVFVAEILGRAAFYESMFRVGM